MFFTMNKFSICLVFFFLLTASKSFSQEEDAGLWTSIDISKKLSNGYTVSISEELRLQAIQGYDAWIRNEAQSMTLYLLAVEGTKLT